METSPTLNSSIRSILIAGGAIGVSKGWWDQDGLEGAVDHIIVFGGALVTFAAFAWGIYAKWPQSSEAKVIAMEVVKEDDKESSGR